MKTTTTAATDTMSIHNAIRSVIALATEAAHEHVRSARFYGEEPTTEYGMGLWQTFCSKFPKDGFSGDRDLAIAVFGATYSEAVKAILADEVDAAKQIELATGRN